MGKWWLRPCLSSSRGATLFFYLLGCPCMPDNTKMLICSVGTVWVHHQNRASPFASDFYRRRGYRKEFRSEDHFYPFSSQKKSRFASDFLRRGNRERTSGPQKSRFLGERYKSPPQPQRIAWFWRTQAHWKHTDLSPDVPSSADLMCQQTQKLLQESRLWLCLGHLRIDESFRDWPQLDDCWIESLLLIQSWMEILHDSFPNIFHL